MSINSKIIQGGKRKSKTYEAGRTCEMAGCSTILSKYNPDPYCYQHRERKVFYFS